MPATMTNPWPARLKAMRERRGLTQAKAANAVGVALATWFAWEQDRRRPGRITRRMLARKWPELA